MLKATGVVRKVDILGRIVIPIEIRKIYDISEKNPLEIFVDGEMIVLKKYQPACIFCGNAENIIKYHDKILCQGCLNELAEQLDQKVHSATL